MMLLENVTSCPVCNETSFTPFLICRDYTTSEKMFHVEQCTSCELLITTPRPTEKESGSYYQSKSYISHTSAAAGIMDYIYLIVRGLTLSWKYKIIQKDIIGNRLLDMGCGTGSFLNYCTGKGINAFGVEPSTEARAAASNTKVVESLKELDETGFDAITLWHVLEHVYDLENTINILKNKLAENGTIFIAVPNWKSYDSEYYKAYWAGYDVPRHVWHFSKNTMTRLIENQGLQIKKIIPMKLDSFYVSLLSEKYKANGKLSITGLIKGIILGMRSNIKGHRKVNNSSLIYLIQK